MVVAQYIRMLRRRPLSVELIVLGINFNLALYSNICGPHWLRLAIMRTQVYQYIFSYISTNTSRNIIIWNRTRGICKLTVIPLINS